MNAVEFNNVSIVFGNKPAIALPLMDQGLSRGEIQEQTGQILGVHDCSLTVKEGEILVLMGLSGSGKSTLLRAVNGLNPLARGEVRVMRGNRCYRSPTPAATHYVACACHILRWFFKPLAYCLAHGT